MIDQDGMLENVHRRYGSLLEEVHKVIIGQDAVVEHLVSALFARGHCLMIGVPGLAKTLLVKTLGERSASKACCEAQRTSKQISICGETEWRKGKRHSASNHAFDETFRGEDRGSTSQHNQIGYEYSNAESKAASEFGDECGC